MKKLLPGLLIIITAASCHINIGKRVKGNGRITTEERAVHDLSRIKIRGGLNVELVPGPSSLKIETDENLLRYIETVEDNGWVVIGTKNNTNLKSDNPIRVYISTERISAVHIAGSGYVKGRGKFSGADRLDIEVAGSGDVALNINTPKIKVDIEGSGSVTLSGETKDANVDIAGSCSYQASDLLTENTDIEIKGSGDAKVYADNNLSADVYGSGTVYYRGKARVRSSTAGSGSVKSMP